MNILTIGSQRNLHEVSQRLGEGHRYTFHSIRSDAAKDVSGAEMIFDFLTKPGSDLNVYRSGDSFLFLNSVTVTLRELLAGQNLQNRGRIYGFNGLEGFVNQGCFEVSALDEDSRSELSAFLDQHRIEHAVVDDRVGMVTPRIICMIINEAYNTVQEGTASRSDIDLAMKLGTNYPYGPFEWCERIGLETVYTLLEFLWADTHDERFRISPLLKKEYLDARARMH